MLFKGKEPQSAKVLILLYMNSETEVTAIEVVDKNVEVIDKKIEVLKHKTLVCHNALITARYEMTLAEKDIVYMLMAQLREDDPVDKVYTIYVQEIEKLTGKEVNYRNFERNTMKLVTRGYRIKEGDNILQVCLVSSVRHIKGQGKIEVRIDPGMRPYLFNLKKEFTKHGLFMAISLQSIYSRRLYEMLCQFKHTGLMRISLDELKDRLCIINPVTKRDKYANWSDFTRKVVEVAKRELEEHTDINFTYAGEKRGRKYTNLEFKINYTQKQLAVPELSPKQEEIYKRLTERHQLSKWQADLILKKIPEDIIHRTLYDIQVKNINGEIKNMGGFTANAFENIQKIGLLGKTA
jgi:plasmid replication initiation protein